MNIDILRAIVYTSNIVCAIFLILLSITYWKRKNIKNTETSIYNCLLLLNAASLITELIFYIVLQFSKTEITILIIEKMYYIVTVYWMYLFTIYNFAIVKKYSKSNIYKIKATNKKRLIYSTLILIAIVLSFLSINRNYTDTGQIINSTGAAPNTMFMLCFVMLFLDFVIVLKYKNKIEQTKALPLYLFLFLIVVQMVLTITGTQLLVLTLPMTLVSHLMYHTIENPDMKMIEQLNIAKDQADKANQAKTEFLSSMSHEIRTPLNAIVGFSECMLPSNDLSEIKGFAKDIVDASHNLLEIVNGILDISKIEANKMEVIQKEYNPREVFNSLCKLVKPRISTKPIEFKVNISPDLPGILKGDMGKVKQVVLNLLTNAAKYTDEGSIEFNITCVNRVDTKKCLLYIAVKDTGRGIKKEDISKLFNKFERIDEDRNTTIEGTGLGLAITKSLTEMMGGKITVDSKFEEGSVFRIYLEQEIISMDIPESNTEEIEINYNNNPGKRILIVDDSKINLKVANQIIKPYNFNVKMVESGYECLEAIETGTFDLILMDIMMPKMNGVETLRRLKSIEGFDIPVVALTADAIEGTDEKYLNAGFDAYLSKPIDRYELDRVLNKYLGGNEDE